jgi:glycosyltransferase involved in cell wall biosynthesis
MYTKGLDRPVKNIGFISTRFQGTDGVSLETEKWIHVLEKLGFECFFFAGASDWDPERTMVVPEAFWEHPRIAKIQGSVYGKTTRDEELTGEIHNLRKLLKARVYEFIDKFTIDVLIVENALAIPMNIPLGLAITEVIAETAIPSIGHHHDFYWERTRFLVNSVPEYISMAFPPKMHTMVHVVINTENRKALSYRRGLSSIVIPNVFDFSQQPPQIDEYASDFRQAIGVKPDDILLLQPTRVIARKGIEHALELANRMKRRGIKNVKLLISHQSRDEGQEYYHRIVDYAQLMGVDLIIKPEIIGATRGRTPEGDKIYSLWDIYPHADFVTYPSTYEGFGNAFLEAVFFKKPIMVNRYSIYQQDIEPLGFHAVMMDTYITDKEVSEVLHYLEHPEERKAMVEKNFTLARKFFSYDILEQKIRTALLQFGIVDINGGCEDQ